MGRCAEGPSGAKGTQPKIHGVEDGRHAPRHRRLAEAVHGTVILDAPERRTEQRRVGGLEFLPEFQRAAQARVPRAAQEMLVDAAGARIRGEI